MLRSIPYTVLNLAQLLALCDQIYKVVKERHPEEASLAGFLKSFSDAIEQAKLALASTIKEELTDAVETADALRDDCYVVLLTFIRAGLRRSAQPAYQQACERLFAIFDQNGGYALYNYSYNDQTAALESLLKDLDSPQAQADIEAIEATQRLKELKAAHEAFKAVYAEREKARATKKNMPTDKAATKLLQGAREKLFIMLDAHHLSGQVEGIDETIDIINSSIKRALASARQSTASRQTDEPEKPEEVS